MRHPYRTGILAITAVVLLTGCSTSHTFRLLLVVKNADDGQPIAGVTVILDKLALSEEHKFEFDYGATIGTTDPEGKATAEFNVSGYSNSSIPRQYLKLSKDGFEPQVIDIHPSKDVKAGETTPLPVTVELKPLPKKP